MLRSTSSRYVLRVMRLRFTAAFVSSLMLIGAVASLRAQSLAELAKKEEERRKAIGQPSKVYTNKDLGAPPAPSTPPPSTATPSSSAPATAPSAAPSAEKAPEGDKSAAPASNQPVKDHAYWSGRKKALVE